MAGAAARWRLSRTTSTGRSGSQNGPQLTLCKVVITYKYQPSQPQFTAVFKDWDFAPRIADPVFVPELPPGTQKIPFATVTAAK
jgi:hypothetical protein